MSGDSDPLAEPDEPAEAGASRGREAAATVRTGVYETASALGAFVFTFLRNLLSLPLLPTGRLFKGLAVRFMYAYHKKAGGDRLGMVEQPGGKIDLVPAKYKTAAETDDDEQAGWHVKGRQQAWRPAKIGQLPKIGKTPVIPLPADSWRATTTVEASIAEAVDHGDTRPVYDVSSAQLTATKVEVPSDPTGNGYGNAVTDGGEVRSRNVSVEDPALKDMIIEIGSGDYAGTAVSWRKTNELLNETTTSDEMERQEQRGILAGKSMKDMASLALKIMLIGGGVAALGLVGPELVNVLFGGGSGGGGGVIPI